MVSSQFTWQVNCYMVHGDKNFRRIKKVASKRNAIRALHRVAFFSTAISVARFYPSTNFATNVYSGMPSRILIRKVMPSASPK